MQYNMVPSELAVLVLFFCSLFLAHTLSRSLIHIYDFLAAASD